MPTDPVLARRLTPDSPTDRFSRRQMLKVSAGGAAALAFAGNRVESTSAQGYQGELVIVSVQEVEQAAPTIDAIEAASPGVTVTWRHMPSERFTELFTAAEVAGDQIDIMDLNGQDLRRYALGERLQDLSGLTYLDRFLPVARETYTIKDKLWALPRGGVSGFTFFCNLKAFQAIGAEAPPATYADLVAMAPDLKAAGYAPFVHAGKNIYLWPVWQFWAYGQTSGNKAIEGTFSVLAGDTKFTDPEHVAGLEILQRFTDDGMFIDGVNSLDSDAAWLQFTQGKAAFFYTHAGHDRHLPPGGLPRSGHVADPAGAGGRGSRRHSPAAGRHRQRPRPLRRDRRRAGRAAASVMDLMTSDEQVKALNDLNGDPVSCNANVVASDDPLALIYAEQCSPNQTTYLDWFWPPEITRAFQENQQAIVAGDSSPEDAADDIQSVLEDLYADDYEFQV